MKTKKKNKRDIRYAWNRSKGFTIIETLISLLLVSLALLSITITIIFALDLYKKSHTRFMMAMEIESWKNQLLSKPFDSIELGAGTHFEKNQAFDINWNIDNITPTLKIIHLFIASQSKNERLTKQTDFYKSTYINPIKEVVHD